jgi:lysophospholipid acyltransferase (LPLAT)-like uncharacterized protein
MANEAINETGQAVESITKPKVRSGIVIPHRPKWHQQLAAWIVVMVAKGVLATMRFRWADRSGLAATQAPQAIYAIWHNRLALSMKMYFGYVAKRNRSTGLAAMVSASKDGGLLAAILERFKVQPVRGSSSRRGPQALLELTSWAKRGYDLAITPDGPRGPKLVIQQGVMALAQLTGLPIIPVSCYLSWKIRMRSWDGFQIPLPFSRCDVIFEKPVCVPREASDAERERLRQQLEATLRAITLD